MKEKRELTKEQELLRTAYRNAFLTEGGIRILRDLAKHGMFLSFNYSEEPGWTSEKSVFREGKRALFLYILRTLDLEYEQLLKL